MKDFLKRPEFLKNKKCTALFLILVIIVLSAFSGCVNNRHDDKSIDYNKLPIIRIDTLAKIGNDSTYFAGKLRDIIIISDSVMIVSDPGKTTIEQFNIKGKHLGTIAKKGKGPGELPSSFFSLLSVNSDTLFVRHGRSNRVDCFVQGANGIYQYVKSWKQERLNRRHISILGSHTGHKFYAYTSSYSGNAQKYTSNLSSYSYRPVVVTDKFNNLLKDSIHTLKIPRPIVESSGQNLRILGMPPYQYGDRLLLTKDGNYLIARPDSSTIYFYNNKHKLKRRIYLDIKERSVEINDLDHQFELMEIEGETRQEMEKRVPNQKPPFLNIWISKNYILLYVDKDPKGKLIVMLKKDGKPVGKFWLSNDEDIKQFQNGKIFTIKKNNTTGHNIRIYKYQY